jgi:putative tricarboxylic transport membrane protein
MIMSLSLVTYLTQGSKVKGLMMAFLGLILGVVGSDRLTGKLRFVYDFDVLKDGLGIVPLLIGLFGVSEVLSSVGAIKDRTVKESKIRGLLPTLQDWKDSFLPIFRGSFLGFFMGILPGIGLSIPTFISYGLEKKLSKHPERFGSGAIEGVAGPETCNNATSIGNFVPMLSLGIPTTGTMALFLGALILHGVQPGPLLIQNRPDIFWGLICSMYIGNIILVLLNLPLIAIWVQLLRVPYSYLSPMILLFCLIGAYSVNNMVEEVAIMIIFGGFGYLLKHFAYESPPLILAFVLGPMIEERFRQSLTISQGSFSIFFAHPISATFLFVTLLIVVSSGLSPIVMRRFRKD